MVLKANLVKLVIDDLIPKAKLVLILTVLKVKFDCTYIDILVSDSLLFLKRAQPTHPPPLPLLRVTVTVVSMVKKCQLRWADSLINDWNRTLKLSISNRNLWGIFLSASNSFHPYKTCLCVTWKTLFSLSQEHFFQKVWHIRW